jgi:pyocin large subunit-like protein
MIVRIAAVLALAAVATLAGGPGFRSQRLLDDHFRKHGHEFGKISKADYLRMAQELRDAPAGGPVLEAKRADGVITRFDRRNAHFGAYDPDSTIRTFFIPAAGESYFRGQARRPARE